MAKTIFCLHDQTTEVDGPDEIQNWINLLFGPQPPAIVRPSDHFLSIRKSGSDEFHFTDHDGHVFDHLSLAELLDILLDALVQTFVRYLKTAIAVHAASVAWKDRSILIAGPTGSGKTSLAGWLVSRGLDFLSDELVILPGDATTLSFPRPLLAKSRTDALLRSLGPATPHTLVETARNFAVCFDRHPVGHRDRRQSRLIVFPRFIAGQQVKMAAITPAAACLKLMECNLNARNLADYGMGGLSAFARAVPAVTLTFGDFSQLDGVLDALCKFLVESETPRDGIESAIAGFSPSGASTAARWADHLPDTSRPSTKKLTIGMATYDDYDGVYFTVQSLRLFHPEIQDDCEIVVIDDNPGGACAHALQALEGMIPNYRYVSNPGASGTAGSRNRVFREANGEFVLCIDCHVMVVPGALKRLVDYCDRHPGTIDLLQGPLLYDDLRSVATHFKPVWQGGMFGRWETDDAGMHPDNAPFDVPMQGLGLFACRRGAWPGFNPRFRGFGGEEGYIHERVRRRGGRTLCLPFLRWIHRFNRPMGVPYPNCWADRLRNYLIGFEELGWDTGPVIEHFKSILPEGAWPMLLSDAVEGARCD